MSTGPPEQSPENRPGRRKLHYFLHTYARNAISQRPAPVPIPLLPLKTLAQTYCLPHTKELFREEKK
jgi:hypothetical protein